MVDALALIARFFLVGVFAIAAVAKLRDREGTAEALRGFGVPKGVVPAAIYLLPGAEALGAIFMLLPATYVLGASWSLGLLSAFTGAIIVNLAQGKRPACRCFGEVTSEPIGVKTVIRNSLLAALAVLVIAAQTSFGEVRDWIDSLGGPAVDLALIAGFLLLIIAAETWLLMRTRASLANVSGQLKAFTDPGPAEIPIGADAPDFELETVDGRRLGLAALRERGKTVILTFTDPHCEPCQRLVPQLAMWQQSLPNVFTVGVVSRGAMEDNTAHAQEHGLTNVMVQEKDEVGDSYAAPGTPAAVRVTPEGKVESTVAVGFEAIVELFEGAIAEHAESLWQRATGAPLPRPYWGLKLGSEPPEFILPDLDGRERSLRASFAQPTLLVFWSPRCGFCHQMIDDMRDIEGRLPDGSQILYVTLGTPEENRYMGLQGTMLIDKGFEVGQVFMASGTPSAVLIEDGRIASPLESGVDAVLKLSERLVGPLPQRVSAPTLQGNDTTPLG